MSWAFLVGILVMLVGLLLSFALHEIGHLVPAKLFGVRCTQYMVGFGPTIWSTRRGETEYGIKALPLGGYVRMIGMLPPTTDGTMRATSTGMFQGVVESARQAAADEIRPGDEGRLFYRKPWWQKLIVMVGGPFMNFILAIILLAIWLMGFGVPTAQPVVASVSECVIPASEGNRECRPTDRIAPANGRLQPGDRFVAFNGEPIATWEDLTSRIRRGGGAQAMLEIERAGAKLTVPVDLISTERAALDDPKRVETVGFLGVGPAHEMRPIPVSTFAERMGEATVRSAGAILHLPKRMVAVWDASFGGGEREKDGPIGVVGMGRLGGEIAELDISSSEKIANLIALLGQINLALFIFNLLPLLPFDGGHAAGAIWEALRNGWARIARKPRPSPVDISKALPLTYAMAVLILGMSALLIYADLVNPVRLSG